MFHLYKNFKESLKNTLKGVYIGTSKLQNAPVSPDRLYTPNCECATE